MNRICKPDRPGSATSMVRWLRTGDAAERGTLRSRARLPSVVLYQCGVPYYQELGRDGRGRLAEGLWQGVEQRGDAGLRVDEADTVVESRAEPGLSRRMLPVQRQSPGGLGTWLRVPLDPAAEEAGFRCGRPRQVPDRPQRSRATPTM